LGLGAKFQYNLTAPIRLEGSFTYFLEKNYTSMWDLNANVHYLFPVSNEVTVYPLAGLGIHNTSVEILWIKSSSSILMSPLILVVVLILLLISNGFSMEN